MFQYENFSDSLHINKLLLFCKLELYIIVRGWYSLKNIPNSTEKQRALDIMKKSFIELGYEEYAEKVSSVEALN